MQTFSGTLFDGIVLSIDSSPSPEEINPSIPSDISISRTIEKDVGQPLIKLKLKDNKIIKQAAKECSWIRAKNPIIRPFVIYSAIKQEEVYRKYEELIQLIKKIYYSHKSFQKGMKIGDILICKCPFVVTVDDVKTQTEIIRVVVGEEKIYDHGSTEGVGYGAHNPTESSGPILGNAKGILWSFTLTMEEFSI